MTQFGEETPEIEGGRCKKKNSITSEKHRRDVRTS